MGQICKKSNDLNDRPIDKCSKYYLKGTVPKVNKDSDDEKYLECKH
jgi:hypothetical protein